MYIIIVGGGRVGYHLASALLEEGHEVLIIEKNASYCDIINEELGSICYHGDGCEAATLTEVGTNRADMLVAVTGDDEDNLVACQIAKAKFKVPRVIARIRNPQNKLLFEKLGIDVPLSATELILEAIEKEVPTHPLTHLLTIGEKGLEIVEVRIPLSAKSIGKSVQELALPEESKLALIIPKDGKPSVPNAETVLQAYDQIIALTPPEHEGELRAILTGT